MITRDVTRERETPAHKAHRDSDPPYRGELRFNEAGQAQHLVVNHRPRSALLYLSRLMGEKFAGTPIAEHFLTSES